MVLFLVSAGPTREYIDDVRFLSNASSGRMGYALAQAALALGHEVHLVTGPVGLVPPPGAATTRVVSAREMGRALRQEAKEADIVLMTAAVSDYRPARRLPGKLKKPPGPAGRRRLRLDLVENTDILAGLGRRRGKRGQLVVGFALEARSLVVSGQAKLRAKAVDLVVANPVASMEGARTQLTLLHKDGKIERWAAAAKEAAAERLVRLCLALHQRGGA